MGFTLQFRVYHKKQCIMSDFLYHDFGVEAQFNVPKKALLQFFFHIPIFRRFFKNNAILTSKLTFHSWIAPTIFTIFHLNLVSRFSLPFQIRHFVSYFISCFRLNFKSNEFFTSKLTLQSWITSTSFNIFRRNLLWRFSLPSQRKHWSSFFIYIYIYSDFSLNSKSNAFLTSKLILKSWITPTIYR